MNTLIFWKTLRLIRLFLHIPIRLLRYIEDIFSTALTLLFTGSATVICLALLMIQIDLVQVFFIFTLMTVWMEIISSFSIHLFDPFQSHDESNSVVLFESIFCGIMAVNLVFIACEIFQFKPLRMHLTILIVQSVCLIGTYFHMKYSD